MNLFQENLCPEKEVPSTCPVLSSLFSLLDRIPALVWVTDRDSKFTSLTGAGLQATDVAAKNYANRPVEELFAGEQGARARWAHARALQGESHSFDATVKGRDLRAHVMPLFNSNGDIQGVIGVALDLTERMVAERALRLSEQSSRSFIDEAPYAICRCTLSGQLLQVNPAMLEMLGYDAESQSDLLVRDLPLIFAGERHSDRTGNRQPFDRLQSQLLEDGVVQGLDAVWIRRDGKRIQVRISGRLIRDPAGDVSHFDLLAEDTTEKKQLEEQLSQAQKIQAIGQLAGGVAHDFNNLLTVIRGNVDMMMRESANLEFASYLNEVRLATDRAAALTKQLLAFSRRQVLQNKVVNLNQVIGAQMSMLKRLIKENVELTFRRDPNLGAVRADPNQIGQVLLNLALNAQDAMPHGGELTIETSNVLVESQPSRQSDESLEPGEYVQILVRDTGKGMDRATQERIFEPFFTTKKLGAGTGLGLSMAYGFIRQSGGHIRVESADGAGSTFRIYLPRVAEQPEPSPLQRATDVLASRGSETIPFAEDEPSVRDVVEIYLRKLGYRVLSASDGVAALNLAVAHRDEIHLLLSDFVMPKVGGRDLAEAVRKIIPGVKVIFLSGYAGPDVDSEDLTKIDAYFLPKPLPLELLATTVRAALNSEAD